MKLLNLITGIFLLSCGPSNQISERDTKREQNRNYYRLKNSEFSLIEGRYIGSLLLDNKEVQKVFLVLTVKDDIIESDGSIDPNRIPRLAGFLRLGYAADHKSKTYISYSLERGSYDAKTGSISLELENSQYGSLNFTLTKSEAGIFGLWLSPETSESGGITLIKIEKNAPDGDIDPSSTALDKEFKGYFEREATNSYHLGKIVFHSQKNSNDHFNLLASLAFYNGDWSESEYQIFTLSRVNFNPLTGAIRMLDTTSNLSLKGLLRKNIFTGSWSSSYTGEIGSFSLSSNIDEAPQPHLKQELSISRTYFGKLSYNHYLKTYFPENMSLKLSMKEDLDAIHRASITGKIRFYLGPFTSQEYVEIPFSDPDYNTFSRSLTIRTQSPYQITISAQLENGLIKGKFIYGALGEIANFTLSESNKNVSVPPMHGRYKMLLVREQEQTYQVGSLQLLTSYDKGIKIEGIAKIFVGSQESNEYLNYNFPKIELNPESSMLTFSSSKSEIFIQALYKNGSLTGEWFSQAAGLLGPVKITKQPSPTPPAGYSLAQPISGTYRGKIRDNNPNTSLPEKVMLILVSSRDEKAKDGIAINGSIRLYLGDFDSLEYREYTFAAVNYNFYTGEFNATTKSDDLTIKAFIHEGKLMGDIFHDGFGKIGPIEVNHE